MAWSAAVRSRRVAPPAKRYWAGAVFEKARGDRRRQCPLLFAARGGGPRRNARASQKTAPRSDRSEDRPPQRAHAQAYRRRRADAHRGRLMRAEAENDVDERGPSRASTQPVQTNPDRALRQLRQCGFGCDRAHAARDPTASAALVRIGGAGDDRPRDSMAELSPRPRSARTRSPLVRAGNLGFASGRPHLGDWRNHPVSSPPGVRSALSHHRDGRHVRRRHGDERVASAVAPRLPARRPACQWLCFFSREGRPQTACSQR